MEPLCLGLLQTPFIRRSNDVPRHERPGSSALCEARFRRPSGRLLRGGSDTRSGTARAVTGDLDLIEGVLRKTLAGRDRQQHVHVPFLGLDERLPALDSVRPGELLAVGRGYHDIEHPAGLRLVAAERIDRLERVGVDLPQDAPEVTGRGRYRVDGSATPRTTSHVELEPVALEPSGANPF